MTQFDTTPTGSEIVRRVAKAVERNPAAMKAVEVLDDPYIVGGAVRDAAMGVVPKDIDLMAVGVSRSDLQYALMEHGGVEFTGNDFPVYRFFYGGSVVEISLPRVERSTGIGHREFKVEAGEHITVEQDLGRRDFTVNAMAVSKSGRFIDLFDGLAAVAAWQVKAVSNQTIQDDPLRTLRAFVLVSRYQWVIERSTELAITEFAPQLSGLPAERIQAEMDKIMAGPHVAWAIWEMHRMGVLAYVLPEVDRTFGYDQNNPHHELDLGDHLLSVLELTAGVCSDVDVRMAALLHDIGKPASQWRDPVRGSSHYYRHYVEDCVVGPVAIGENHELVGANMTRLLLNRLRYSMDRNHRITALVEHHMWDAFTTKRGARRFLARVGQHSEDLLLLRWADNGGKTEYKSDPTLDVGDQMKLVDEVRLAGEATDRSMLAINGHDLIAAGMKPGRDIGLALQLCLELVVDDPSQNTKERLLRYVTGDEHPLG